LGRIVSAIKPQCGLAAKSGAGTTTPEGNSGDLNQSNALTRLEEAFAVFVSNGTGLRDAFHDKKVSDTDEEEHHRSEVLTGAAYKIFLKIYDELKL
jgi:hypothetical protein